MLNVNALRAEMVKNGYNQQTMARELGITSRTFGTKLKTGNFGAIEMGVMIKKLNLSDPMSIFFAEEVT